MNESAVETETQEFCDNIKKHVDKSGLINRFLGHLVFVGLPGSGKSTLIARLLKLKGVEKMLKACASTGVMDSIITVNVADDEASMYPVNIIDGCEWERVEYGISCLRQMGVECFILADQSQQHHGGTTSSETQQGVQNRGQERNLQDSSGRQSQKVSQENVSDVQHDDNTPKQQLKAGSLSLENIRSLLKEKGFSAVGPFLNNKCTLYLSDTGGQIEFQELLPLLVAGRAIFVFLFPLNLSLDKPVRVSYRKKVKDGGVEHCNEYTSSLTIRESFLQTMASIDSMEAFVDPSIAKHNPYVFVVGTHKDCLVKDLGSEEMADQRIAEVDSQLKALIQEHKYEDLVIYADTSKSRVIFPVDNTRDDEVFNKIRARVSDLVRSSDEFRIQFPLSYLLASLDLEASHQPFIRRQEFARDVLQYGIESDDIDHLLQFLHSRIGQIRYFPKVKETIVRKPQALFNLVTCLIVQSFLSQTLTMSMHSERQKGIYEMNSFNVDEFLSFSSYLTPEDVIELLKELRIVAPFHDKKARVEKYFFPCVLNHLEESPRSEESSPVQPLAVMFECGHCPKGMFGVLLHYLVTKKKGLEWSLDIQKIFKEQVSFEVGPYGDIITLKFCTTHMQVSCHPVEVTQRESAFSLLRICNAVRFTLASGIEQATVSLHYDKKKTQHAFGLVCGECGTSHKVMERGGHHMISKCSQHGYQSVPQPGSYWFGCKLLAHHTNFV